MPTNYINYYVVLDTKGNHYPLTNDTFMEETQRFNYFEACDYAQAAAKRTPGKEYQVHELMPIASFSTPKIVAPSTIIQIWNNKTGCWECNTS